METIQLNLEMSQYFILIDSLGRAFYDIKKEIVEHNNGPVDILQKLRIQSFCGIVNLYKQCLDIARTEFPENIADDLDKLSDDTILAVSRQGFFQGYLNILEKNQARGKKIKKNQQEPTN